MTGSPSAETAAVTLAVVGDGSGPAPAGRLRRSLEEALAGDAAIVEGLSGIATAPLILAASEDLLVQVKRVSSKYGALFLVRTGPERARALAQAPAGGDLPAILTEEDACAAALCAAVLRYLQRSGKQPERSRVLVADAAQSPSLVSLLVLCGLFDVGMWNEADAEAFPLPKAARDADVVVDLRRPRHRQIDLAPDRPAGSVIKAVSLDARALVAPGLLRAVSAFRPGEAPISLGMLRLSALAIAAAAPAHVQLPSLRVDGVADLVEAAARRAIDPRVLGS